MEEKELIPYLFRTEYSKIVAVLCKTFGLYNIQLAEDIVSDSFLKAAETWGMKGIPDHPKAWLYQVAKNKAKDQFKRNDLFKDKINPELKALGQSSEEMEIDLSDDNIKDSQLQMMFTVCDPVLSKESQIVLALRVLCSFSIEEIASALLSNKSTINKRLYRAKDTLRKEEIDLSFPENLVLSSRLDNVLSILYLLFNEGYFSTHASNKIRKDLCLEAMRLLFLLIENKKTNVPEANALMALFCFHSSRFEARINQEGEQVLFDKQDRGKWDKALIDQGNYFLSQSASGDQMSKLHLEAMIAFWHTQDELNPQKKWDQILQLYNRLLQVAYSPMAALNRTFALAMSEGKSIALKEALKINLKNNHLYHSLVAELYDGIDTVKKKEHLETALKLAKNEKDQAVILRKIKSN